MAVVIKAKLDKTTKRKYRYIVGENEYGLSGTLYRTKTSVGKKPKKRLKLEINIKKLVT